MSRFMKNKFAMFTRARGAANTDNVTGNDMTSSKSTPHEEREDPHYSAHAGEALLDGRYLAVKLLGSGRYSQVWLAKDTQQDSYVALKFLSRECYGTDHDIFEIEILEMIAQQQARLDDAGGKHVIGLIDTFQITTPDGNHRVVVMPVVGCSLSVQAKRFPQRRIPLRAAKQITKQLLLALAFLHDKCKVIHTDLQPSNICFEIKSDKIQEIANGHTADEVTPTCSDEDMDIRIIDLGVASWVDKHLSDNIQPEHLRAPEVIIGAPWGPPVDIWSLGCLVIEFVKGYVAFNGAASASGAWNSNDDHLAQHMEVLGPMPANLLRRGVRTADYFTPDGSLLRIFKLQKTSLEEHVAGQAPPFRRPDDMSPADAVNFVDFLRGALALDPDRRKTASELLKHAWLQDA